jgi:hypothetical protein
MGISKCGNIENKEEMQDKVRDNSYHCNLLQQPTE